MKYAHIENGTVQEIITLPKGGYTFPDGTSTGSVHLYTPAMLLEKGFLPVEEVREPVNDRTQKQGEVSYNILSSKVVVTYPAINKTQEEKDADFSNSLNTLRSTRNRLLGECDWTQLLDATLTATQKTAWSAYRQSLRDLPNNLAGTYPADIIYPTKPM